MNGMQPYNAVGFYVASYPSRTVDFMCGTSQLCEIRHFAYTNDVIFSTYSKTDIESIPRGTHRQVCERANCLDVI